MKIAQIHLGLLPIPPNGWGAVEKIIWNYTIELRKMGHHVDIPYINEVHGGQYDIVHVHVWNHALELFNRGVPYIFTCHDHHTYVHGKDSFIYQKNLEAMKHAELAIVPAPFLISYFENIPIYLEHGVDLKEYTPTDFNQVGHKILCVGNNGLSGENFDRKGFRYAIEAAKMLDIPITVAGPTKNNKSFFEENQDLIVPNLTIAYDLNDRDLIQLYHNHTILVHATSIEAGHPPLTLLEAAGCGIPILTTDCAGGLYSIKVDRDVNDVKQKIASVLQSYDLHKNITLESVKQFEWKNIVKKMNDKYEYVLINQKNDMRHSVLGIYKNAKRTTVENKISVNFVDGPFLEITGPNKTEYKVEFIDRDTGFVEFSTQMSVNTWSRVNKKWFTNWQIKIIGDDSSTMVYNLDLSGRRVFIVFESSSLGDTLAWIPYVEEFRKKHNCHVIVSTFHNNLFRMNYQELEFVEPGTTVDNLYALYRIGIFLEATGFDTFKHKTDYKKLRLQEVASDILGLDFQEIRPRITRPVPIIHETPYICIANHSTAQLKYWNNNTGWQELVDYVKTLGYDVYLLSKEDDGYMGNKNPTGVIKVDGKSLEEISSILLGSVGFVGISSGLSWLAWSLEVPTVLISGCTEELHEPSQNIERIINTKVCNSCFSSHIFDKGDWNWCPIHNGTERQFECSKEITFDHVMPRLNKILGVTD